MSYEVFFTFLISSIFSSLITFNFLKRTDKSTVKNTENRYVIDGLIHNHERLEKSLEDLKTHVLRLTLKFESIIFDLKNDILKETRKIENV